MRSPEICSYRDEGHCRRPAAVFRAPARSDRDLPACSESALSAEQRSSTPYSQVPDRASVEGDEDSLEARSSFGRRPPLPRPPAAVWHFQGYEPYRAPEKMGHELTIV